jgi:hypothetical protein
MFLFLIFFLVDQIETCVAIYKLVSLRFRYFTCFLLSNGQFHIPKTLNIQIKQNLKFKIVDSTCAIFGPPQCAFTHYSILMKSVYDCELLHNTMLLTKFNELSRYVFSSLI